MKPCPFCASNDIRYSPDGRMIGRSEGHVCWCGNCGCFGPNDISEARAREMWNLRRPEAALVEALEILRDYVVNEIYASGGDTLSAIRQADAALAAARQPEEAN